MDKYTAISGSKFSTPLDITKTQWLGAGRVRIGFYDTSGSFIPCHEFFNTNINNTVYMRNPNLPVRGEVVNQTGGSSNSMEMICNAVFSEAGKEIIGVPRSADRATGFINITAGDTVPVLSIRMVSSSIGASVMPTTLEVLTLTSNVTFKWSLHLNPTFTTDNAVWQPVVSGSAVEYDTARTGQLSNPGQVLMSGYGTSTAQSRVSFFGDLQTEFKLGYNVDGQGDELVLAVNPINTGNFIGAIRWIELY